MCKIMNQLNHLSVQASLLVLNYDINVQKSSKEFLEYMNQEIQQLEACYEMTNIVGIINIKNTREAYKQLGKSPSSYRNAAEAMLRRIVKGKGLYPINNVVDIHNLISVQTGFSIGSYLVGCLRGNISWKRAEEGSKYQGIGKELLNIEYLPTLYDEIGPFGNPTSDSQRAMITEGNHQVMTVVYSFSGTEVLEEIVKQFEDLLSKYTDAKNISWEIIG